MCNSKNPREVYKQSFAVNMSRVPYVVRQLIIIGTNRGGLNAVGCK